MYPDFAETATQEGFKEIAALLRLIAKAEKRHEERYLKLAANLEAGTAFKRQRPQRWVCRKCGYIHEGTEALKVCPLCKHPQSYFEIEATNY